MSGECRAGQAAGAGIRHQHATDDIEDSLGFKIVTGKGTLVTPGVQTVRRLSLDLREAELFTSVYDPAPWPPRITDRTVHSSFLDRVPGANV